MFNACEFTYAGQSSSLFGLMLYDFGTITQDEVAFGNAATIFESRTNTRIQPIHYGVNYNKEPLSFKLVFGKETPIERYELERIALWLTGYQEYQWLSINQEDMDHVRFKALVTSLKPLHYGWLPYAFEATFRCDCPYAYGLPFKEQAIISNIGTIEFHNNSSVRDYLKPFIKITPKEGNSSVTITNTSDNDRKFTLNIPGSVLYVTIDSNTGIMQDDKKSINMYDYSNMKFPRMVQGINVLDVTGSCEIEISGRFLHNISG